MAAKSGAKGDAKYKSYDANLAKRGNDDASRYSIAHERFVCRH